MFDRFTNDARRAIVLASDEAWKFRQDALGTEHLLLGILHEENGIAVKALNFHNVTREAVSAKVEELIGMGSAKVQQRKHIPFTPRARLVMELTLRQALQLNHPYIGSEHILLGIIREGEGVAVNVLTELGVDLQSLRDKLLELITGVIVPDQSQDVSAGEGRYAVRLRVTPQELADIGQYPTGSVPYLLALQVILLSNLRQVVDDIERLLRS